MAKSRKKRAMLKQQRLALAEQAKWAAMTQLERLQHLQKLNRQADEILVGTIYDPGESP